MCLDQPNHAHSTSALVKNSLQSSLKGVSSAGADMTHTLKKVTGTELTQENLSQSLEVKWSAEDPEVTSEHIFRASTLTMTHFLMMS